MVETSGISMNMEKNIKILFDQINERHLRILYTHTYNSCEADVKREKGRLWKYLKQILSGVISVGVVSSIFATIGWGKWIEIVTALLSVALFIISFICEDGKFEKGAHVNMEFANKCRRIRNEYESLLTDIICEHITIDEVVNRRNQLEKEEAEVFVGDFPEITKRAKKRADKQLKKDSRYKSTFEERKSILPSHLNLDIE